VKWHVDNGVDKSGKMCIKIYREKFCFTLMNPYEPSIMIDTMVIRSSYVY